MYKIKSIGKKMIMIFAIFSFLIGIPVMGAMYPQPPQPPPQPFASQTLNVAVLSEPRIFPQSLFSNTPAFNSVLSSDIAMLHRSQAILDAAIDQIIAQAPDVLLVNGNLTKDGEVASHEFLAGRLNHLRTVLPDIKIYVINGNRDINNPNAVSFVSQNPVPVPSPSSQLFRSIYDGLGYGDSAYAFHDGSNSYVARPAPGFTIIAVDTASGTIASGLLNWITQQAQAAEDRGDTVIAFMHHNVVPHSSIQTINFPGTLIADYEYIGAALANAGIRYVFSGALRANNISQLTVNENTLTDISTASLTAFPSPIRFANFVRGVQNNRRTETVDISTQRITSIPGVNDLTDYGSRMVNREIIVSLTVDSVLYDMLHSELDQLEATEFVNTRGVRHTGIRAAIESVLPVEDGAGNPVSNDFGDVLVADLRAQLPHSYAEGIPIDGGGRIFYNISQNRMQIQVGPGFLAPIVYATDNNIRTHLVNPAFTQLNNLLVVDRTTVNNAIDQLAHDLINMNIYPLPQPDGSGGYTDAGSQYQLFDLARYAYLAHLAGDEQIQQWMLDVIENLNNNGPLLDNAIGIILDNLATALDDVLNRVIINTNAIFSSNLAGIALRAAVVDGFGNTLGSILYGMGLDVFEVIGELGNALTDEMREEFAFTLTYPFLAMLINYGYPNDNNTTLHWIGGEVTLPPPVDRTALGALIAEAHQLNEADYTPESWANFDAMLTFAQTVYNNAAASQEQVDDALSNLTLAMAGLIYICIHCEVYPCECCVLCYPYPCTCCEECILCSLCEECIVCGNCECYVCNNICPDCNNNNCEDCAGCTCYVCSNICPDCGQNNCADCAGCTCYVCNNICPDCGQNNCEDCAGCTCYVCNNICPDCGQNNCADCAGCTCYVCNNICPDCGQNNCEDCAGCICYVCSNICPDCGQNNCADCASCICYVCNNICPDCGQNNCADCAGCICHVCTNICPDCGNCLDCDTCECGPVPVDRTALRALINEAHQLNEADYTPTSWEIFDVVLMLAEIIYDYPAALQEYIDEALYFLTLAIAHLEYICIHCEVYPCECCVLCYPYPCTCCEECILCSLCGECIECGNCECDVVCPCDNLCQGDCGNCLDCIGCTCYVCSNICPECGKNNCDECAGCTCYVCSNICPECGKNNCDECNECICEYTCSNICPECGKNNCDECNECICEYTCSNICPECGKNNCDECNECICEYTCSNICPDCNNNNCADCAGCTCYVCSNICPECGKNNCDECNECICEYTCSNICPECNNNNCADCAGCTCYVCSNICLGCGKNNCDECNECICEYTCSNICPDCNNNNCADCAGCTCYVCSNICPECGKNNCDECNECICEYTCSNICPDCNNNNCADCAGCTCYVCSNICPECGKNNCDECNECVCKYTCTNICPECNKNNCDECNECVCEYTCTNICPDCNKNNCDECNECICEYTCTNICPECN
ncbi:MAG: hypothetical protein FWC32_08170, partial [Firmicutes bacterium]|nr:hypothetical protein [Bacillota bacterium]